ncbi:mechanosensitive ion channel family protein [Metapseudomonas boanensis]|uniref:Small-conductance mechanosensitive channel n=1 Tax=Metapseudomonas boanensis TaxID=2822138 RepID=A0ABS5XNC6_9GAMM|nr:mechanosensitive ion channel family protein [Pseudomonas boanensis]MBT8769204.1 mechanosensitive ion channel family protein [Pseudomonas boanensis]
MLALVQSHPLVACSVLLLVDLLAWRAIPTEQRAWRAFCRLVLFLLYSWVLIDAGVSPLQPPPFTETAHNLTATALEIVWWLFGARTLTVVLGLLMPRIGHAGRLLQDVLGAVIFLIAIVAAAAYVMQLPVKGLLATSGVMAIVIGLALQSTLSDVFSGIVLNTTKPYQLDDWIAIDGTEGKVVEIDWRATHLLTSQGNTVVIPNSVAAKAKILNYNRPNDINGVSISLTIPAQVRPRRVLDALEKTIQGISALLPDPKPKVAIKGSDLNSMQYEASGFVRAGTNKAEIRNLMYDLAHRHLEAAGIAWNTDLAQTPWTRQRLLLDDVKIFRALSSDEKDRLSQSMLAVEFPTGQVLLAEGEVSDCLLVIATGVVSASVADGNAMVEVGRMGPGEILGEEGIVNDSPSQARFTTLTSCVLYRIEKDTIRTCLDQRIEVRSALNRLRSFREQASNSLLLQKPQAIKKGGFLSWLHKK